MGFLDTLIYGYRTLLNGGSEITRRNALDVGAGLSVADDSANGRSKLVVDSPSFAVPALSIDWSQSRAFSKTLATGAQVFTFANATDGQCITIAVTGVGGTTVTWPTVAWASGVAPTQTAPGTDVYTFTKIGSTIYGSVVQDLS